jgi:enoyl-CoA hydratase
MPLALELEVVDRCLVMTFNRPDRRNAVNAELGRLLLEAVERLDSDPALRVGVITGNGSTFCAGMDLKEFGTDGPPRGLFRFVRREARKPLIAAVNGPAYAGGLEIALACDVVVASRSASFGLPEVSRGLIAGAGGLYRLPRKVGEGLANLMILTGEPIDAEQARDAGLVSVLVEDDIKVRDRAIEIALRVAENSPLAVRSSKRLLEHAQGITFSEYWDVQRQYMRDVGAAPDAYEGAAAFVEGRRAQWRTD